MVATVINPLPAFVVHWAITGVMAFAVAHFVRGRAAAVAVTLVAAIALGFVWSRAGWPLDQVWQDFVGSPGTELEFAL